MVVSGVIVAAGVAMGVIVAAGFAIAVNVAAIAVNVAAMVGSAAFAMAKEFVTMESGLHLMMLMAKIMILEVLTSLLRMSMLKLAVP